MPINMLPIPNIDPTLLWPYVKIDSLLECWEWQKIRNNSEYGTIYYNGKSYIVMI
jgi:hypothetical protein